MAEADIIKTLLEACNDQASRSPKGECYIDSLGLSPGVFNKLIRDTPIWCDSGWKGQPVSPIRFVSPYGTIAIVIDPKLNDDEIRILSNGGPRVLRIRKPL